MILMIVYILILLFSFGCSVYCMIDSLLMKDYKDFIGFTFSTIIDVLLIATSLAMF